MAPGGPVAAQDEATPAPAATPVATPAGAAGQGERFVRRIYQDLLGRQPTADELATRLAQYQERQATVDLALSVLRSTEYETLLLLRVYGEKLGRTPTIDELTFWLGPRPGTVVDE